MTDDELVRRYEALHRAATAVIESTAADPEPVFPTHQQKLDALAEALNGRGPRVAPARAVVDPNKHLWSVGNSTTGVPGGAPSSFADEARSIRRSMADDD